MKKTVLLIFILISCSLRADTTIRLQEGWQLIGTPQAIENLSVFDENAEILWAYDSQTQQWQGYSSDANLTAGIENPLTSLAPFQAFWIKNKEAWSLELPDATAPSAGDSSALLQLHTGWNLVSLPAKSIVSADLFDGMKLWRYDEAWQNNFDAGRAFPKVDNVSVSEGFWLYSDVDKTIDIPLVSSKLHTFETEAAMENYIREMILMRWNHPYGCLDEIVPVSGGDIIPMAEDDFSSGGEPTPPTTAVEDATTTNIQEAGVDESDILKHDGNHIFFYDSYHRRIRIYSFDEAVQGSNKEQDGIDLDEQWRAMYLTDGRLIVVTSPQLYYYYDYDFVAPQIEQKPHIKLYFYDVTDLSNLQLVSETTVEGNYNESRLTGGTLYLASHFYPSATFEYPVVYPDTNCSAIEKALSEIEYSESCYWEMGMPEPVCEIVDPDKEQRLELKALSSENECYKYNYDENHTAWLYDYEQPAITSEALIPVYEHNGTQRPYVTPQKLHAPYKIDQESSITSIGAFDVQSGDLINNVSYIGDSHTIYASSRSLYLAATSYPYYFDFNYYAERTAVYKFGLDHNLTYKGRGMIEGRMLSQYSMSERNATLRTATTSGFSWGNTGTDNMVFALQEKDETLEIVGELRGLGEEGETIRAVRFVGDRGYVVTFRQTDPFYTIDLSDPTAPYVAGELKIEGFSEYLHPVDENRILSIGRDADAFGVAQGFQIQLYDVSDFSAPLLADKIVIGTRSTYSEAEYNPRAFAYRDSDKLFGFPMYDWSNQDYGVSFDIYQVDGLTLQHRQLVESDSDGSWYDHEGRGIIYDYNGTTFGTLFKTNKVITEPVE